MAETLFLAPRTGVFDVTEIARFVSGLGYAVEDPARRNRFAIFADQDESARFAANRVTDPKSSLPYVCVIVVAPDCVTVNQLCEAAVQVDTDLVRTLAVMLTANDLNEIEVQDGERKIKVARAGGAALSWLLLMTLWLP